VSLQRSDLTTLSRLEQDRAVERLTEQELARPFDLSCAPLLRARLIRVDEREHVLMLTTHHIVSDGHSMEVVMIGDLASFYAARCGGQLAVLPGLKAQYSDYVTWQRERMDSAGLSSQRAYWRKQLAGLSTLHLPRDRPRPAEQSYRGGSLDLEFPPELAVGLRRLAGQEGFSLPTVLLAAWQVLLSRLADEQDVVVGSPMGNRDRPELEALVGVFLNVLVLRTDLSGDPTFRELLLRVREVSLSAFENQDVPFEKLVEQVNPLREGTSNPLFQVLFSMQYRGRQEQVFGDLAMGAVTLSHPRTDLDLELRLLNDGDWLGGRLIYHRDLFDRSTIVTWGERWLRLLSGIVADPGARLSSLSILGDQERRQLLVDGNDTAQEFGSELCLHELFAERAGLCPDATALIEGGSTVSFAELDASSNQLAHLLSERGVASGSLVGLFLPRSCAEVIGLLAVLKAGAAYVPLDPQAPSQRLAFLLKDTGVQAVITSAGLTDALPTFEGEVICCDRDGPLIAEHSGERVEAAVTLDHPAYVLYTSGSTGTPKGVVGLHRGAVNRLHWERSLAPMAPGETGCHKTQLGFVDSVHEIFGPLCAGARLLILGDDEVKDVPAFVRALSRHDVTRLVLVPSFLSVLLEQGGELSRQLGALRHGTVSGERLPLGLARRFAQCLPAATLWNLYGSTEVSGDATLFEVSDEWLSRQPERAMKAGSGADDLGAATVGVPIGRPLANVRTYVLDDSLQPVPVGVPGELYIGGQGLADGYLHRPEWTAAVFVPDPFGSDPGARLFRTGDRVRWAADGNLEFLGRLDRQAKIRGQRIEPGELEAALLSHSAVEQAAAMVRQDSPGGSRLVAYVVPRERGAARALLIADIERSLRQRLPAILLPSAIVTLDALPLTPSGKLDRLALPEPGAQRAAVPFVAPRDGHEETLCALYGQLLGVSAVGVHDDFFSLGGHSLLATQLTSRIAGLLGVEVPLRRLFENPTVAGLARIVGASVPEPSPSPLVPRTAQAGGAPELPLSTAQQRLWILEQAGAQGAYTLCRAFQLKGPLDVDRLELSLTQLLARHEVLRTTFPLVDGLPVQRFHTPTGFRLERIDAVGTADVRARVRSYGAEEAGRPFDLAQGPLIRGALLTLGEQRHVLWVSMHHIVSDGWSMGVFFSELSVLYGAAQRGEQEPLAPLALQYGDFALWHGGQLQLPPARAALADWCEQLADLPPLDLPTDRPRPSLQTYHGDSQSVELAASLTAGLAALALQEGVTQAMVLLASWQLLLARLADQEDVAVGLPIAQRTRSEWEPLIGCFVNTLVVRTDLSADPTFAQLLARVKGVALSAYEGQDVPFEQIVTELNPPRDPSRSALFQVLFTMQNGPQAALALDGLEVDPLLWDQGVTRFDLELACVQRGDSLGARWTYNVELFDASTVQRMVQQWLAVLEQVCVDPSLRLHDVRLIDEVEQQRLLVGWNPSALPASELCLHELFQRRAAACAESVALIDGERTVSYGELDARSGQLARHLREQGLGCGDRVGLALPRSTAAVVAMVAVLKAGGVYVPLDPENPPGRLQFVWADAALRAVITEAALRPLLAGFSGDVICVDRDAAEIAAHDPAPFPSGSRPDHGAYVLYTSGSSGHPKGVLGLHRGAVQRIVWEDSVAPWGDQETGCHKTHLGFVDSVHEVFGALCGGARLLILADDDVKDTAAFVGAMSRHAVTRVVMVPSLLAVVLDHGHELAQQLPRLVRWTSSGEPLPVALARRFVELLPGAKLRNVYGSTEVSADATTFDVTKDWLAQAESDLGAGTGRPDVPIGRPMDNARAYVLDRWMQLSPTGVPGELYIGGSGLARGYLNQPELTATCFVADPFSAEPGARLYRTGDRARWSPDGQLECLGRRDRQAKIRGQRIEPGEVEACLHELPSVHRAHVLVRDDREGDPRLVAYVVLTPAAMDTQEMEAALLQGLRAELPSILVPSALVVLDAFPLTASGKIDGQALPRPKLGRSGHGAVAPRTDTERALCAVWCELLGLDQLGVHEDFFALGGHSLLGARLINRLAGRRGHERITLRNLFERPTVAGLAELLDGAQPSTASAPDLAPALPPSSFSSLAPAPHSAPPSAWGELAPRSGGGDPPLSFAQQRLWFLDQLGAGAAYNLPVAYRIRGSLDVDLIDRCLADIVRRHETLRTGFVLREGLAVQQISSEVICDVERVDLRSLAPGPREAAVERQAREAARRPFDLTHPPLMRAAVLRCTDTEHVLLLTLHHAIADGWSMERLADELSALYGAFRRGQPSPLKRLAISYADFSQWQRAGLVGAELERQMGYWRGQLSGLEALSVPSDHPRPAVAGYASDVHDFALSKGVSDGLRALAHDQGATLSMVLVAAWQVLLSRYCGVDDVAVGLPLANRQRVELEPLIGFFVNTLVLRVDLSGDPSFSGQLLPQVKDSVLAATEHQDLPFEKLVEELDPSRDPSRHPLYQVSFAHGDEPQRTLHLPAGTSPDGDEPELDVEPLRLVTAQTGLDLDLRVRDLGDHLGCRLLYDSALFEAATMETMAARFGQLLRSIATDPQGRLSQLSMLTGEQVEQLEGDWQGSAAADEAAPVVAAFPREFAARAAECPETVALHHGSETVTYGELNSRANQLAHVLRSRRAAAGELVGLALPRGPDQLVALLGILKAGAAYLPLDTTLPDERLEFMIKDMGLGLVITDPSQEQRAWRRAAELLCLVGDKDQLDGAPRENPSCTVSADDLAYGIYTSGSSGAPKAALLEHGGLSNVIRAQRDVFDVGPGSRVLQFASLGFDASLFEITMALAHGGTLFLGQPDDLLPGAELQAVLRSQRINVVTLPPTVLESLSPDALPELAVVAVAGERCPAGLVDRWATGRRFFNLYGLTEASIWSTVAELRPGDEPQLGRPIDGVRVGLVDPQGQLLPPGMRGEIVLGGLGLARGYHGRAELTAERFVPDPFAGVEGRRLYRTGDLACSLPGGGLQFIGRADSQVKLRGQRLELGEIEETLRGLAGVEDAAVVLSGKGDKGRLVAYVTGVSDPFEAESDWREVLGRALPRAMVPGDLFVLERLPRSLGGKVDRRALLRRADGRAARTSTDGPSTATEQALAEIWCEMLELKTLGRHDHFIDLGGHSLLAVPVLERMHEALGVRLTARELLFGTLAQVSAACDEASGQETPLVAGSSRWARALRWLRSHLLPRGVRR